MGSGDTSNSAGVGISSFDLPHNIVGVLLVGGQAGGPDVVTVGALLQSVGSLGLSWVLVLLNEGLETGGDIGAWLVDGGGLDLAVGVEHVGGWELGLASHG